MRILFTVTDRIQSKEDPLYQEIVNLASAYGFSEDEMTMIEGRDGYTRILCKKKDADEATS